MNKRLSHYQIFMIIVTTIMAGILLLMGVIAMNKSMTLKLGLKMEPSMLCAIYVNDNLVFNNKTSEIASGVSLSANELKLNSTNTFGAYFNLKIENLNEFAINISLSGCTVGEVEGYETAILPEKNTGNIEVSSAGLITITMTEADVYYVQYNANNGGGEMATSTHIVGTSSALSANAFTAPSEDVEFAGWATSANGEVNYENNALILNAATPSTTIQLYAVWKMKGYKVTFETNNWAATYKGEQVTSPLVVEPNGNLTVTVAGSGTQEGYSVHSSPTVTKGTVESTTFDRYTGTLTLTNIQSDLIISATDFRPWTYGEYKDESYAWYGYKYIVFANKSSGTFTNSDGSSQTLPLNWIIIGAGANVNTTLSGVPTGTLQQGAYGGTLNSVVGTNADSLANDKVLLLSQYILAKQPYDTHNDPECIWQISDLCNYLNGDFLTASGLSSYSGYIQQDLWGGHVFVLGMDSAYKHTTYLIYKQKATFEGVYTSFWWLRDCSYNFSMKVCNAYTVDSGGGFTKAGATSAHGVRPCFVLNLA